MDDAVEAERRSILLAGAAEVDVLRPLLLADAPPLIVLLLHDKVGRDRLLEDEVFELLVVASDGNGDETHRVLPSQTHPHEKIANPSPSPSTCAGLNFCPSPKPVGFSKPTGNPSP